MNIELKLASINTQKKNMQPKTQVLISIHAIISTLLIGGFENEMMPREKIMVDGEGEIIIKPTLNAH